MGGLAEAEGLKRMNTYSRLLVAVDGSNDSKAAVAIAARLTPGLGVPVELITVTDDDRTEAWAKGVQAETFETLQHAGVTAVTSTVTAGNAAESILAAANKDPEQLVVVGASGLSQTTSRLVGSTSNKLAHNSIADVLFAQDPPPKAWNFVGLATDGSPTSHLAVQRGLQIAAAAKAKAHLITAAKSEEAGQEVLDETWRALDLDNAPVSVEKDVLVNSQPAGAIANNAWKYAVVAIGNRGMSGPMRLLGSVASKITHDMESNLLLVNTTRD